VQISLVVLKKVCLKSAVISSAFFIALLLIGERLLALGIYQWDG